MSINLMIALIYPHNALPTDSTIKRTLSETTRPTSLELTTIKTILSSFKVPLYILTTNSISIS